MPAAIEALVQERLDRAFGPDEARLFKAMAPSLAGLVHVTTGLPAGWIEGENVLLAKPGAPPPPLQCVTPAPRGAVVALNGDAPLGQLLISGERPLVILGAGAQLPAGYLYCGDRATMLVGDGVGCTWAPSMDARNGGLIAVGPQGLWAARVRLQTDDMHAIRSLTGERINGYGGVIGIDRHVWLGDDALVLGGARIGADTVLGARSLTKARLEPNSVYAGAPARRIRQDVTWAFEDLP